MRPATALVPLAVIAAVVTGVALFALSRPLPPPERKVRLAVLVVFDQMRGDYLERWRPLFGPNGFVRLQRDGAWFTHCHYPYGTTEIAPDGIGRSFRFSRSNSTSNASFRYIPPM